MTNEREILAAIAEADRVLAGAQPTSRELYPDLARRDRRGPATALATTEPASARQPRPVTPAAEAKLTPEQVGAWSAELGFTASATQGRVTRAAD